jgi:nitroreductase
MDRPAKTDYPIHDLLRKRWSPRAFDKRPIEPAKIKSLLEAARWAPSSYNEQPWAFIVATNDQPADFARVLECFIEFNRNWASGAPLVMLTVAHLTFDKNAQPNRHAFHDIGLAMANFTVQATAEGLAVHQMAGIVPEKAREVFAIPEGWEAVTGVAVGYPGDPNSLSEQLRQRELAERTRKPLASFVFTSAFGKVSPLLT